MIYIQDKDQIKPKVKRSKQQSQVQIKKQAPNLIDLEEMDFKLNFNGNVNFDLKQQKILER